MAKLSPLAAKLSGGNVRKSLSVLQTMALMCFAAFSGIQKTMTLSFGSCLLSIRMYLPQSQTVLSQPPSSSQTLPLFSTKKRSNGTKALAILKSRASYQSRANFPSLIEATVG